jgi:thiol-disulfide isomerase/thioredoxin
MKAGTYWSAWISCSLLCFCCADKEQAESGGLSDSSISIKFIGKPADTLLVSASTLTILPQGFPESRLAEVFDTGVCIITMELDRPNSAALSIGDKNLTVFIAPGDTTRLEVDPNGFKISFYGRYAAINEYYQAKQLYLCYSDTRYALARALTSRVTFERLKDKTDSIAKVELGFLNQFNSPPLPEWFIHFETSEIQYMALGYITVMPHYNELFHVFDDQVKPDYFNFAVSKIVDNASALNSSKYFAFPDDYFIRGLELNEFIDLKGEARMSKIVLHRMGEAKKELHGDVLSRYRENQFSVLAALMEDSVRILELANKFEISNYRTLISDKRIVMSYKPDKPSLSKGEVVPTIFLTDNLDSTISLSRWKGNLLYLNFWATWCGPCIKNMPNLNNMVKSYDQKDSIRFVNICLSGDKDKWGIIVRDRKLQGVNLYAEGQWADKIYQYFALKGFPQYAIVDRNFRLLDNTVAAAPVVQSKLDSLLKTRF